MVNAKVLNKTTYLKISSYNENDPFCTRISETNYKNFNVHYFWNQNSPDGNPDF